MSTFCSRCGGYKWHDRPVHGCHLVGKVWEPDCGETEDDADEVWSLLSDPEDALDEWCKRADSDSGGEAFQNAQTIAFRTTEGTLRFLTVTPEYERTYHISDADEAEVKRMGPSTACKDRTHDHLSRLQAAHRAYSPDPHLPLLLRPTGKGGDAGEKNEDGYVSRPGSANGIR